MKILFICLDLFPYEGACTSLLNNMFEQKPLRDLGEIHVLTIGKNKMLDYEIIDGIRVHRFFPVSTMNTRSLITDNTKSMILKLQEIYNRIKKRLPSKIIRKQFCNNVLVKELTNSLCEVISKNQFDIVIPMSGAYETAMASLRVCKERNIKLGFYQVDPCSTNQVMDSGSFGVRYAFEQELIDYSAFVITTKLIKEEMDTSLKQDQSDKLKIMEFPNVSPEQTESHLSDDGKIHCLFAGKLYAGARDPSFAIHLFSEIKDKRIVFDLIGVDEKVLGRFIGGSIPQNIICHGHMPLQVTKEEIQKAAILVNIGNIVTNQVPSKLFEYISSGKPIVNLCSSKSCPSIPYMKKYPLAINLVDEKMPRDQFSVLVKELEEFITRNAGKIINSSLLQEIFNECTPEYCASFFADQLKKAMEESVGTDRA